MLIGDIVIALFMDRRITLMTIVLIRYPRVRCRPYVSCEPSEGMKELFPEQYGVEDDSFEEEETEQE